MKLNSLVILIVIGLATMPKAWAKSESDVTLSCFMTESHDYSLAMAIRKNGEVQIDITGPTKVSSETSGTTTSTDGSTESTTESTTDSLTSAVASVGATTETKIMLKQYFFEVSKEKAKDESTKNFSDTNDDGYRFEVKMDESIKEKGQQTHFDFKFFKDNEQLYWAKNLTCVRQ